MDYNRLKKLNTVINAISGNCYPITADRRNLSIWIILYVIFTWILQIILVATVVIGMLYYIPPMKAFKACAVPTSLVIEMTILAIYLNARRGHMHKMQSMFKSIIIDDDTLNRCLIDTIKPHKVSLTLYMSTVVSNVVWGILPLTKLFQTNTFTYDDFIVPAYFPGEPFSIGTFFLGVLLQTFSTCYLTFKKIGIDMYITYFMIVLTAEFEYVREELAKAFRRDVDKDDLSVIAEIRRCVDHHSAVIKTGNMFVDLLAVNIGITYILAILRFCFLGFSFIEMGDSYSGKIIYIAYGGGMLLQLYVLCSCVQALLDASMSVTDDAFHEDWHTRGCNVQKMFSTIILTKRIECRLTAYKIVDMTTPTLASILNQSFSACLLLLKLR